MLKYSHGMKYDLVQPVNADAFFLTGPPDKHTSDSKDRSRSRSPSARTFWKSPYSGNNSILRNGASINNNIFLRSEISLNTPPYVSRSPSRQASGTVKGILKNKDGGEGNHVTATETEVSTPRGAYGKPNLITTGTGDAKPHGTRPETKSAGKRVQFNNLPKQNIQSKNNFLNLPIGTATSSRGRRLYFNRTMAVRVLGSPNRCEKYGGISRVPGQDRFMATASLNSGESYIKAQINDFVRKLRLAESAKKAQNDIERSRVNSGKRSRQSQKSLDEYDQWREYDIERYPETNGENGDHNDADSGSVSLESLESPSETNIAESTPGGAEVYRRRAPMAALFTKYRHITNNTPDLKRYEKRSVVTSYQTRAGNSTVKSTNFCDNDKTSQILGWLEDMRLAQTSHDPGGGQGRTTVPSVQGDDDPVTRVAQANSVAQCGVIRSVKEAQSYTSQQQGFY